MKSNLYFNCLILILSLSFLQINSSAPAINDQSSDGDVDLTLNQNGTIFSEFGTRGANIIDIQNRPNLLSAVTLDQTNRITAAGYSVYDDIGNARMVVARYTNIATEVTPQRLFGDGVLDPSIPDPDTPGLFFISLGQNSRAFDVQVTYDNNVIVGGFGTAANSNIPDFAIVKILPEIGFDTTFNPNGQVPGVVIESLSPLGSQVNTLALVDTPAGQNIVAGGFARVPYNLNPPATTIDSFALALYNPEGQRQWILTLPPGEDDPITIGPATDIVYDRFNQKIIALAPITIGNNAVIAIIRINLDGTLDETFQPEDEMFITNIRPGIATIAIPSSPRAIAIDNLSRLLITTQQEGTFTIVIRLNSDGSFDTTFAPNSFVPGIVNLLMAINGEPININVNNINLITNQNTDYKIVISGFITDDNDQESAFVARLTQNGEADQEFNFYGRRTILQTTESIVEGNTQTNVSNVIPLNNQVQLISFIGNINFDDEIENEDIDALVPIVTNYGAHIYQFQNTPNQAHRNTRILGSTIDYFGRIITAGGYINSSNNLDFLVMRYKSSTLFGVDDSQVFLMPYLRKGIFWPAATSTIYTNTLNIVGRAESEEEIEIKLDNVSIGTTIANENGYWNFTLSNLENRKYNVTATSKPDGSTSTIELIVSRPTDDDIQRAPDQGLTDISLDYIKEIREAEIPTQEQEPAIKSMLEVITQGLTAENKVVKIEAPKHKSIVNTPTPLITGSTEPNSILSLEINGQNLANIQADNRGNWSYQITRSLKDGQYKLTTVNTKTKQADTINIDVDTYTQAPENIQIKDSIIGGQAEPNSIVTLFINNRLANRIKVSSEGQWNYNLPIDQNDIYKIDIAATDAAGNTSQLVTQYTQTPT